MSYWSEWEKWDGLFHRAVAEASGKGILISSVDQLLRIKMHPRWTVTKSRTFDPALLKRYSDEYSAVLSAIANRDPNGADAAMRRHMLGLSLTIGPVSKHNIQYILGGYRYFFFANFDALGVSRYLPILLYVAGKPESTAYLGNAQETAEVENARF